MNSKHRNRQKMFHKLSSHLVEQRPKWENESLVSGEIDHLLSETKVISGLLAQYEEFSKPFGEIHGGEREEFNQRIIQLSGVLHGFSIEAGKEDVAYLVGLSPKALLRDSLERSVLKAQNVLMKSTEFSEQFEAHPTAKACLEKAKESYENFRRRRFLPSDRRSARKLLKERLERKQSALLEFLRGRLDMKMRVFMDLDKELYQGYSLLRSIKIGYSSKKKEEDVTVEVESHSD